VPLDRERWHLNLYWKGQRSGRMACRFVLGGRGRGRRRRMISKCGDGAQVSRAMKQWSGEVVRLGVQYAQSRLWHLLR
jgi:hypothetical protein